MLVKSGEKVLKRVFKGAETGLYDIAGGEICVGVEIRRFCVR
jgi:hypothetical protein